MYISYLKRLFDIFFAFFLLIAICPILIVTCILLYLFNNKEVFFVQKRPGLNEVPFQIYKFKTMVDLFDENGKLLPDEKRITKIGSIIRKFSIDELLQLFNVLKGEMSIVGPRPLLIEYLPLYNEIQRKRHLVKPGITGWAQVNGRNAINWDKKFELDIFYVENLSFLIDLKIICLTIYHVIKRTNINSNNHATMPNFKGSKLK